jgi:hypothetical protein
VQSLEHFGDDCRPAGIVQADRPKSGRPAWQGSAGDLPGRVTLSSGLRIGSSKYPFRSSRKALRHGAVKYVIWVTFAPCPSLLCLEMNLHLYGFTNVDIYAPYYLYFLAKYIGAQKSWNSLV